MRSNTWSTQLGGIADLALMAVVRPGFVEGFETVTFVKRLELLLRTLNGIRLASRESQSTKGPFPDLVGRIGILHSFRYAIVPPALGADGAAQSAAAAPDKLRLGAVEPPVQGRHRLSLNVAFDGGWEPYLRVIHRDLGPLLDAIFCNCEGYRTARAHSFDEYTRWVRDHEVASGLFYTESAMTVKDQRYLEGIERIYREGADTAAADAASGAFALREPPDLAQALAVFLAADKSSQDQALRVNLKALKALHDLRPLYGANADQDDQILLRFARSAMREFVALLGMPPASDSPLKARLDPFAEPVAWITKAPAVTAAPAPRLQFDKSNLQAGIVSRYEGVTHGCVVLLRVADAASARRFLASLPVSVEGAGQAGGPYCNVALTAHGLQALGIGSKRLEMFPQEFIEGMENRAGLLGDVRTNHPHAWRRPVLRGSAVDAEVELANVHVVVQFRLIDPGEAGCGLHPMLDAETKRFDRASGLSILAVEAMRSYPESGNVTREHFGFQDGISQPIADGAPASKFWKDGIARGEILLGYANDRGDGPYPASADPLLDDGGFLVLRKIRQRLDVLDRVLKQIYPKSDAASLQARIELKELMMGRRQDGRPLVKTNSSAASGNLNDFDYGGDAGGAQCPFHSHARRANPRAGERLPRIIRRGMSYGPRDNTDLVTERGVYFIAHCASIAEQFEVIQRWVAGGNSSGVLSTHSDPLLGVPQPGDRRVYRYPDASGNVMRVEFGDQPFTELQWGLYLFVPSIGALKKLDEIVAASGTGGTALPAAGAASAAAPPAGAAPALPLDASAGLLAWQRALEDPGLRDEAWSVVSAANAGTTARGTLQTDYGLLVADPAKITAILQDTGRQHSVEGYGRRLTDTVGIGYLGLDPDAGHTTQAILSGANDAIAGIGANEAFVAAAGMTSNVLKAFAAATGSPTADGRIETPVDMLVLSEKVLGNLSTLWFGLPDPGRKFMTVAGRTPERSGPARCPGHFLSVARYVFSPRPSAFVAEDAKAHGKAVLDAVEAFLDAAPTDPAQREKTLGRLSFAIEAGLVREQQPHEVIVKTIAGTMLGFPPTVHGNFARIVRAWLQTSPDPSAPEPITSLWNLQADLIGLGVTRAEYDKVDPLLRAALLAQMRKSPVPEMIWREDPQAPAPAPGQEPPKTVLGLFAAMKNEAAHDSLMFGGAWAPSCTPAGTAASPASTGRKEPAQPTGLATVHACPGYEMALGVMMGMTTAILLAGSIRPTPSPTIANLVTMAA